MTLRERCEALVLRVERERDYRARHANGTLPPETYEWIINALQAALDATADEGRDAARLDWIQANEPNVFKTMSSDEWAVGLDSGTTHFSQSLRAAIDAAIKDTPP
jgi:hypothetical protein